MKSVDAGILPQSICFSFTPSELAMRLYFYPTWCGHYYCTNNYFMKRETFPPLLIIFIREGILHLEYRGLNFDAEKGDVVLLDCTEPHYYHAKDGLEFLYMHFDGSNSHEICQQILHQTGPLIKQENNVVIGKLLYDMVKFYSNNGIETMFQSSARIYDIFKNILTPPVQEDNRENPVDKTINYIRNNVGKSITLNELAKEANLSAYYYAHCFKEQTGFSPLEYVINTRLDKAKILLVRTSNNVEEIGYEVGYSSSSSFINAFIKKTGMSPKQYRKLYQSHLE